ncbi:MAG: copper homeostasis periplasmic binding protein CopC [Gammaproteobacteria bacterium]|nr:copper homeostasis periplasmic binding protein CopC [Gammaproteobacteria bacterium]
MSQKTFTAGLLGALLMIAWPLAASAHTHLEKSDPADNSSLATAPQSVQLWFSEKVAAEWSKIVVTDSAGKRMDQQEVISSEADPEHIQVDLNPLTSGTYKVDWNVISGDGHRVKGSFSFSVQ